MEAQDQPREPAREYLANLDVQCPGCGYNLRGLIDAQCPECGRVVELPLPKRRLTRDELVFLGGVAFGSLVIAGWVVLIISRLFGGVGDPLDIIALWVPMLMLVVLGVLVSIWIGMRRAARQLNWLGIAFGIAAWMLGTLFLLVPLWFILGG